MFLTSSEDARQHPDTLVMSSYYMEAVAQTHLIESTQGTRILCMYVFLDEYGISENSMENRRGGQKEKKKEREREREREKKKKKVKFTAQLLDGRQARGDCSLTLPFGMTCYHTTKSQEASITL